MQRTRTIAGSPNRSAGEAWKTIVSLIGSTLERSPNVPQGSVEEDLLSVSGLGAAMTASGILDTHPLVLVAGDLELTIIVKSNDSAFAVDENLDPVPGGAQAPADWVLHLPDVGLVGDAAKKAAQGSVHLSTRRPKQTPPPTELSSPNSSMNLDAFRQLGGR